LTRDALHPTDVMPGRPEAALPARLRTGVVPLALAVAAAACASGRPQREAPKQSPVEEMLAEALAARERGEVETSSLAADAFSWDSRPRDVFTSRDELASASGQREKFVAHDVDRHVYFARDGQSAWFREMYARPGHLVRHTGLAGRVDGKWVILAQHTSFAYGPEIEKRDEEGMLPALAPIGNHVAAGAEEIERSLRSVVFFDRMVAAATPADFVLVGTDPDYLAGTIVRPPDRGADGPRPNDGVRAGLGPNGLTGWAAANVIWMENGKRKKGPMRFLYVFTREDRRWRLVQNHHSYAVE
jgi:hypothetical protein